MPRRTYRTDRRLWAALAAVVFVALGFVDFLVPGKGGESTGLWPRIQFLVARNDPDLTAKVAPLLVIQTAVLLLPSALFGWVMQAVLVALRGASEPVISASSGTP